MATRLLRSEEGDDMSDIVERLRAMEDRLDQEAADEIERLRGELEWWQQRMGRIVVPE